MNDFDKLFEEYKKKNEEWLLKKNEVYNLNEEIIKEYHALPWWKSIFTLEPRQQIIDNWQRFQRIPIPQMPMNIWTIH